ncbi:Ig-like domain-containing protein [Acidovorax sp.]|uniref:Ig-like domain-containing protein n=1 Tax=Acidovorax sp. TaxID=1872122 RepID=UPI002ACD91DA|nr:Ig-like domain-containing protein [Acidovorax sp.]MDZ7862901.1 Ig-like domain-containing protein [Acidovorax sp.]
MIRSTTIDTPLPTGALPPARQVVFVFDDLPDWQTLAAAAPEGADVVVLDGSRDGLDQIAAHLQGRSGIDAIHILSHGEAGRVQLGSSSVGVDEVQARSDLLARIGDSLTADGDILLYGCDVASGDAGRQFIEQLAQATQADVAASVDATGSALQAGNWQLEAQAGTVESAHAIAAQEALQDYAHLLAVTYSSATNPLSAVPRTAQSTIVGDFDGDGDVDVLNYRVSDNTVWLYSNNGSGTFNAVSAADPSSPFRNVAVADHFYNSETTYVADFDGDGDMDIWDYAGDDHLISANPSVNGPGFYLENQNGTYVRLGIAANPLKDVDSFKDVAIIGDFDSDGDIDVLSWMQNSTGLEYFRNSGSGVFTSVSYGSSPFAGVALADQFYNASNTHVADFDGDGDLDIWDATGITNNNASPPGTAVYLQNNNGVYSRQTGVNNPLKDVAITFNLSYAKVGDFDSDGDIDVLAYQTDGATPEFFQNNGSGQFTKIAHGASPFAAIATPFWTLPATHVADFDNDGDVDIWDFTGQSAGIFDRQGGSPPKLTASTPVDNGTAVHPGDNLVLQFNEAVTAGTGSIRIYRSSDNVLVHTIAANGASVTGTGTTTITINPTTSLADLTGYYLLIDKQAFRDADGMVFAGISDKTQLNFTTGVSNVAPTATNLTQTVPYTEDPGAAVPLGDIVITDPDSGDTLTATLTLSNAAAGSLSTGTFGASTSTYNAGTGAWTVSGTLANVNAALAAVAFTPAANWDQDVTITTQIRDAANAGPANGTITLDATPVNDTPTNIALSPSTVAENTSTVAPLTIGALSTTDVEAGAFTYSIAGGADLGVFEISGSNLQFKAGTTLDFEAKASYAVTVRSTDSGGLFTDKAFTVNLTNANEAPTVATPIVDQAATATQAFNFTFASNAFQDPDAATTLTYTATLDGGGALPAWLAFDPATRTFSGIPALGDAGTLQVRVTASDGLLTANDTFALVIAAGPTVTSIVRAGGASATVASAATSVDYTVIFSEAVTGVDASDFAVTPSGTASGTVASVTGSGTTYTVTVNGITGDGTLRLDLKASGTGIENGSSLAVVGGYAVGSTYTLDHTAPAAPATPVLATASDTGTSNSDLLTADTTPTLTGTAEANATVQLYDTDGTTVLDTAAVDGAGAWSLTSSVLSSGAHTLTVKATDAAGNVSTASTGLVVTFDASAPTLAITSNVPSLKIGETATITFTFSEDPGATFSWNGTVGDVVVTGGTLGAISGSGLTRTATFTPTAASNGGTASITVATGAYTDAAGNSGGAGPTPGLSFDTLAPAAPSAPDLVVGSDSGTSSADNITNATTPTLSGTAEAGSTVTLYDTDGTTVLGTAVATGGAWSITSTTALSAGAHTLTAKATDAAGNVSVASADLVLTIDTTPPAALPTPILDAASDTGASNADGITTDTTPTLTGTADANAGVTLYDTDGTTVLGSTVADGAGNWSITPGAALAAGAHTLTTKASDTAGNLSTASPSLSVTIDPTAPVLASATVNGSTLVLTYTDAGTLDAVNAAAPGAFTVMVGVVPNVVTGAVVNAAAKTVTLTLTTAVTNGQVVTVAYADPTGGNDASAIQDAAGNDAATLAATAVTNNTAAPDPGTPPTPPGTPVDGVPVVTEPGPGGSTIITIPVVVPTRPDTPGTPSPLADIPLVTSPSGTPIVSVGVPTGVGLQAEGLTTTTTGSAALAELGFRIERIAGDSPELTNAGQVFYATLAPNEPLSVQILKPTIGAGYDGSQPLVITGSNNPADGKQAVIVDARSLPSGTTIQVDNIEFIAVVGNVRLIGGAGQNAASGDGGVQYIVLGPDDDVIHGGGGNDVVGSLGGDDQVHGDAGDDIVFGGAGNDLLSGGTGSDKLNGGTGFDVAVQEGARSDYTVTLEGAGIKLTHTASGVSDWLVDVEQVRFATGPSLTVAHSAAEEAGAYLFQKWVGRDLNQGEGAITQTLTGKTALEVATLFAQFFPEQSAGRTPAQLLEGMGAAGAIRVDAIRDVTVTGDAGHNTINPTLGLARYVDGGAGTDTVVIPATLGQTHVQAHGNGNFTLQRLTDGAMLDTTRVERVTFNDSKLALDLDGHAGQAAKLLGALGGPALLGNKGVVGEVIRLLDAGATSETIAGLGLQLLGANTPTQIAQTLWTSVVGRAGTEGELKLLTDLMAGGVSAGELVVMAANLEMNAVRIDLVGLTAKGIEFA